MNKNKAGYISVTVKFILTTPNVSVGRVSSTMFDTVTVSDIHIIIIYDVF